MENKIMVERETFESHGNEYYSYFTTATTKGRKIRSLL